MLYVKLLQSFTGHSKQLWKLKITWRDLVDTYLHFRSVVGKLILYCQAKKKMFASVVTINHTVADQP